MSKALEKHESKDNLTGVTIIDRSRYENIQEVTHRFSGTFSVEDAMKDLVVTKLEDKNIIRK